MITENIKSFAEQYADKRDRPYGHDNVANILVHDLPDQLYAALNISKNEYLIKGSVGTGRWADIPWFAIMHRGVTTTTQSGYYIAGLFSHDLTTLFITLGLGWTQFAEQYGDKEGRIMAAAYSDKLYGYLPSRTDDKPGHIELGATTTTSKGYESANAVSRLMSIANLSDNQLLQTLQDYLRYYEIVRKEYGADLFFRELIVPADTSEEPDMQADIREASVLVDKAKALLNLQSIADTLPPAKRKKFVSEIVRNAAFANYVKARANYVCEICGRKPFMKQSGKWYAEADHIDPLFAEGRDHPDNMRCLCAQCHRIVTYGSENEKTKLLNIKRTV